MPQIVTSDGIRLNYAVDGPEAGPVLLLAHPLAADISIWKEQLVGLGGEFRLVRYDSRGHGRSDSPIGDYTLERLGRDVLDLLDHLGLERANFCGVSIGGGVGQWLAAKAPSRIDRLVLANTAPRFATPDVWIQRRELALSEGMGPLVAGTVDRWFTPAFRERKVEAVAAIESMLRACPPQGYAGCCATLRDADLRPDLADIVAPTLVICGRHDLATPPERSDDLVAGIPDARLVTLDAGHMACVEQAEQFNAELRRFLR